MSDGGKGSKRRKEDKKKIDANWDAIFGKKKKELWLDSHGVTTLSNK